MIEHHTLEPFGYFRAEPFGWTDCAETDDGAQPLFDQAAIDAVAKQRDDLLAALRHVAWEAASYSEAVEIAKSAICETGILPPKPAIASVKGGAA